MEHWRLEHRNNCVRTVEEEELGDSVVEPVETVEEEEGEEEEEKEEEEVDWAAAVENEKMIKACSSSSLYNVYGCEWLFFTRRFLKNSMVIHNIILWASFCLLSSQKRVTSANSLSSLL